MALWLVRAGKHGEDEEAALEKGLAIIGWREVPDVSKVKTYEDMKTIHAETFPDWTPRAVQNQAAQLWAFAHRIERDDIVALPLKTRSLIALGKVTGDYQFQDKRHVRPVKWIRPEIPRTDFGQDLLYSLGAFLTVCSIQRNEAEMRIEAMLKGGKDPRLTGPIPPNGPDIVDLEEHAYDQLRQLIEARFKGNDLTRLVEAILQARGYQTYRSPAGPDGGVDILAGHGAMGFESPRICVQVKSGGVQSDIAVRELEGVMSRMNAEQGLFVSWDGFKQTAIKSARELFFKVRLWDDKKLIASLFENYERMPDAFQAELPLKRIWVVVPEESGGEAE